MRPTTDAVIDSKGNFVSVSRRYAALLGYGSPDELVGQSALERVVQDTAHRARWAAIRNGTAISDTAILIRRDGERFEYRFTAWRQNGLFFQSAARGIFHHLPVTMSRAQAAAFTGRSERTIDRWRARGLPSAREAGEVTIRRADLLKWLGLGLLLVLAVLLAHFDLDLTV